LSFGIAEHRLTGNMLAEVVEQVKIQSSLAESLFERTVDEFEEVVEEVDQNTEDI
jgi:hypothetical protein